MLPPPAYFTNFHPVILTILFTEIPVMTQDVHGKAPLAGLPRSNVVKGEYSTKQN
jgi:hypothetical protein